MIENISDICNYGQILTPGLINAGSNKNALNLLKFIYSNNKDIKTIHFKKLL